MRKTVVSARKRNRAIQLDRMGRVSPEFAVALERARTREYAPEEQAQPGDCRRVNARLARKVARKRARARVRYRAYRSLGAWLVLALFAFWVAVGCGVFWLVFR